MAGGRSKPPAHRGSDLGFGRGLGFGGLGRRFGRRFGGRLGGGFGLGSCLASGFLRRCGLSGGGAARLGRGNGRVQRLFGAQPEFLIAALRLAFFEPQVKRGFGNGSGVGGVTLGHDVPSLMG